MTAAYDLDTPVIEAMEATCRERMAELAATPNAWPTRARQAEPLVACDVALDDWNRLNRCG